MLNTRTDRTAIILERVEGDASGNNDRQRSTVERMTILEAEELADELDLAIEAAKEALALERMMRLARVDAEIEDALQHRDHRSRGHSYGPVPGHGE